MSILATGLFLAALAHDPAPVPIIRCDGHEENLATYLEMSDVLFNKREGERAGEFYADEFITHNRDEGGKTFLTVTPSAMAAMWARIETIEPDREVINNVIICNGPFVVAQVTTQGTRIADDLIGNPPEGRYYSTSAIDIYRFEDGKVVERWGNNDMVAKARQLGMELDLTFTPIEKGD